MQYKRSGFSMLELFVAMAIISTVAIALMIFIGQARARGRDARREQDIRQIVNALDLYVTSARLFPVCANEVVMGSENDTCLTARLVNTGAISALPSDPMGGLDGACNTTGSYVYCYHSPNGRSYTIHYLLETNSISGKTAGIQTMEVNP